MNKTCKKCKEIKEIEDFTKSKNNKDGRSGTCRVCRNIYKRNNVDKEKKSADDKRYREKNKDVIKLKQKEFYENNKGKDKYIIARKEYRERNKEQKRITDKIYRSKTKEKMKEYLKEYNIINKESIKKLRKEYYENNRNKIAESSKIRYIKNKDKVRVYLKKNKDKINQRRRRYRKTYVLPLNTRISQILRRRILCAIKKQGSKKAYKSMELLGCSIEFFKSYIENKFTNGMSWENHSLYGWHIDHIIPCNSFDLSDPIQQKKCFHYTNLQPLWSTSDVAISYGESPEYIGNVEKKDIILNETKRSNS